LRIETRSNNKCDIIILICEQNICSFCWFSAANLSSIMHGMNNVKFSYIPIIKTKEMHYFSNVFLYRTLYVSDRSTVHHQESQHCIRRNRYLSCSYVDCLLARSGLRPNLSETCRVLYQNIFEKQCISLVFIIRIYNHTRSSECQNVKFFLLFHLGFSRLFVPPTFSTKIATHVSVCTRANFARAAHIFHPFIILTH
jgi:hypothetical protein